MPPVKTAVPPQAAPVYEAYRGWLAARGVGNKTFDSGARCFLARFPDPQAWAAQPLAARLAGTRPQLQPLLNFLLLHGHLPPGYDHLLDRHLAGVSPQVRRPMVAYLERLQGTHARSSVQGTASELAHFGRFLARHDPGLSSLALLDRQRHLEPYLTEVAVAVSHRTGQPI